MSGFQVRTDLVLEARESVTEGKTELHGVRVEEFEIPHNNIQITKVMIESKNAAKAMGKTVGTYITIEAPELLEADEDYHREISRCLAEELQEMLPMTQEGISVMIIGLGNRDVTADALGPRVLDNLCITRHIVRIYGKSAYENMLVNEVSSFEPGVMAKTGIESAEIVKGVVNQAKPDALIVIDALAARSTKRLNRTIQIANTGIQPGSGVGNHRNALTEETLGIPVIAIGVPTVVDAATIVNDALEKISNSKEELERFKSMERFYKTFSELNNMYMTGKDIDEMVKRMSFTLSEGINIALSGKE